MLCPFDKKKCKEDCTIYRRGMRYFDDPSRKPEPFESCGLSVALDCLENLITRSIGQQKATEQARNEMAAMKELFFALASRKALADMRQEAREEVIEVTE